LASNARVMHAGSDMDKPNGQAGGFDRFDKRVVRMLANDA
jgi:hypothetical protein